MKNTVCFVPFLGAIVACGSGNDVTGNGGQVTASGVSSSSSSSSTTAGSQASTDSGGSNTSQGTDSTQTTGGSASTTGAAGPSCEAEPQACAPEAVTGDTAWPAAFTLVAPYLYWKEDAALKRINLDTLGTSETLLSGVIAYSMGANSTHAFATTDQSTIVRVPVAGGTAEVILTHPNQAIDIEADEQRVYFSDNFAAYSLPVAGAETATPLLEGQVSRVELLGDHLYATGQALVVDGTPADGTVRVAKDGSSPEFVYQGPAPVEAMPTDTGLYLMFADHVEFQAPGGSPTTVYDCAAAGENSCGAITHDEQYLYISDNVGDYSTATESLISRVPRAGGNAEVLARHTAPLFSIKAYGGQLYFAVVNGGLMTAGQCPCE